MLRYRLFNDDPDHELAVKSLDLSGLITNSSPCMPIDASANNAQRQPPVPRALASSNPCLRITVISSRFTTNANLDSGNTFHAVQPQGFTL